MAEERDKASAFIQRLLSNPSLEGLTPLQLEDQILQFLQTNSQKLLPTLSSQGFFPGRSWTDILEILAVQLMSMVNGPLFAAIDSTVAGGLNLSFISFLGHQEPSLGIRDEILGFIKRIIIRPEVRREYTGILTAIIHQSVDKYIEAVYARREYIHFELTKVQRLKMSKEEVKGYIQTTMVIRPAIAEYILNNAVQIEGTAMIVHSSFVEKALPGLKQSLPHVPDQVLKGALSSSTSFIENKYLDATARIAAVFGPLFKHYRPNIKLDRGADTPEKSWINIARRNYKYFGYDIKMLDELYKIAAENGW